MTNYKISQLLETTSVDNNAYFEVSNYESGQYVSKKIKRSTLFWPTNYAADWESTDSYVITLNPAPSAYTIWMVIYFKAKTANTWAATLNVNSLWAKTIVKWVNTTLSDNDILANMICHCVYDWTNFVLLNPRAL